MDIGTSIVVSSMWIFCAALFCSKQVTAVGSLIGLIVVCLFTIFLMF